MKTPALTLSLLLNAVLLIVVLWLAADRSREIAVVPETNGDTPAQNETGAAKTETVVSFQPAAQFSEAEMEQLWSKLVTPYIDYNRCMGATPASISVKPTNTGGPRYLVDVLFPPSEGNDLAVYHGFLYGTSSNEQPYWVPDLLVEKCVDVLPNADEVRDQAIEEYKG